MKDGQTGPIGRRVKSVGTHSSAFPPESHSGSLHPDRSHASFIYTREYHSKDDSLSLSPSSTSFSTHSLSHPLGSASNFLWVLQLFHFPFVSLSLSLFSAHPSFLKSNTFSEMSQINDEDDIEVQQQQQHLFPSHANITPTRICECVCVWLRDSGEANTATLYSSHPETDRRSFLPQVIIVVIKS